MIQTFTTHFTNKTQLTADVYLLRFALDNPTEISFNPSQYVILLIPLPNGEEARRLYSIASPAFEKNNFELLVKIIPGGVASNFFLNLKENTVVTFRGPCGRFVLNGNHRNMVFLSTGTGLAPIRSILFTTFSSSTNHELRTLNYHLLWGVPTFKDIYFLDEFKKLAADNPNFSFTICVSRETSLAEIPEENRKYFKLGRITQDLTVDPLNTDYYIYGKRDVVESVKTYLLQNRVTTSQLIFEKF